MVKKRRSWYTRPDQVRVPAEKSRGCQRGVSSLPGVVNNRIFEPDPDPGLVACSDPARDTAPGPDPAPGTDTDTDTNTNPGPDADTDPAPDSGPIPDPDLDTEYIFRYRYRYR